MKKYIICILGAALALCSCNVDELAPRADKGTPVEDGKVVLHFGVNLPETSAPTKAFKNEPNIGKMYVAVFGEAGWKQEYVEATLVGKANQNTVKPESGATPSPRYQYEVTLSILEEPCHLHFIAFDEDATGDHNKMAFGPEEEVMAQMTTENEEVAYWQVIALGDEGITYKSGTENTTKELNETAAGKLQNIPLIRNFAKFTIKSETSNLVIDGAKVVNVPVTGYVPAYNKKNGGFIFGYQDYRFDALRSAGYIGSAPAEAPLLTPETEGFAMKGVETGTQTVIDYSYERQDLVDKPACVIVHGTYSDGNSYYYRVDLTDQSDKSKSYPVFRNFNYTVTIHEVSTKGYSSAEEAYEIGSSGDISSDVRYEDLQNLSNGVSTIYVQFTEAVAIAPAGQTPAAISFKYKFVPDAKNAPTTVANGPSSVTITPGTPTTAGAAFSDTSWETEQSSTPDSEGFTTITIHPTAVTTQRKVQEFIVKGTYNDVSIQRAVTIIVLPQMPIYLPAIPDVETGVGQEVSFGISLPKDLPVSLFPLELAIEAENQSISPVPGENLTVQTGMSTFDSTKPGYQFIRVVDLSEYQEASDDPNHSGYVLLGASDFRTSIPLSATSIKVTNKYFTEGTTSFKNRGERLKFTNLAFTTGFALGASGVTGTLTFNMSTTDEVTVTLEGATCNGNTQFTYTPSASGVQTISGITPNTFGNSVTVTLSSPEEYSDASLTQYRYGTIHTGTYLSASNLSEDYFGVSSWSGNTGTGHITATIASKSYSVPVEVTRTSSMADPVKVEYQVTLSANGSGKGSGGNPYKVTFTIGGYDSTLYTYEQSSNGSDYTALNNSSFTVNGENVTRYVRATRRSGTGISDIVPAVSSITCRRNSNNNKWTTTTGETTTGSYKEVEQTYTYSFTGPSADTRIDFTSDVSSTTPVTFTAGSYTYPGSYTVANLQ